MSKIISVTKVIIIMLSAGLATPPENAFVPQAQKRNLLFC